MWDRKGSYIQRVFVNLFVSFTLAVAFLSSASFAFAEEMYYSMGQKYMAEENYEMAVLAFENAVKQSPDSPEAHNALGEAYVGLLKFEDALKHFEKAIELKDDYTQAKKNHRRTMMSVERYKPMKAPKLNRWQRFAVLGGVTAAVALVIALIIYNYG
jgi:tetratricopeptide (TPR) repeat protein